MERRMSNDPHRPRDASWRTGPDPDAPPWSGRGRDGAGAATADEPDDADDGDDGDGDDGSAGAGSRGKDDGDRSAGSRGEGDGDGSAEAGARGEDDGDRPEPETHPAAVAHVAPGMQPPRPPRRTGVFLDPEDLREHVGALLRAILGGYEVDAFGNFTFLHEDARVFVTVGPSPIGPQVGVFSVTNLGLPLTKGLAEFLLTANHRMGFGSFSYDPEQEAVWLRHALLGTTLDGPELQAAVAAVASAAATFDDRIQDRFGGRTFNDAPSDLQRSMEPPEPAQDTPPNAGGYL
jgi:hypothetical protein